MCLRLCFIWTLVFLLACPCATQLTDDSLNGGGGEEEAVDDDDGFLAQAQGAQQDDDDSVGGAGETQPPEEGAFCTGPGTAGELRDLLLLDDKDTKKYDRYTRPHVAHARKHEGLRFGARDPEPEVARIQFHILSLNGMDQKRNEYEMSVWFRRSWYDFRLAYKSRKDGGCFADDGRVGFDEDILAKIWKPDFYIENQAKPNSGVASSVWIYPSGRVVYVSQLEMTLACQMQFKDFPHDTQTCGIRVGTFLEDAKGVLLEFYEGVDPVTFQSAQDSHALPHGGTTEWTITESKGLKQEAVGAATQAESAIAIQLRMKRTSEYYTDFVIVPAIMFVLIGWASFFLDRSAAPARVAMSMIGFLANMNFLAAQLGQLPRLGNDVWLLKFLSMSSWFSFYAILEYVLCNYLRRIEARVDGAVKKARDNIEGGCKKARDTSVMKRLEEQQPPAQEGAPTSYSVVGESLATGYNGKVNLQPRKRMTDRTMSCTDQCRIEARINGARKKAQDRDTSCSFTEGTSYTDVEEGEKEPPRLPTVITKEHIRATGFNQKVDLLLIKPNGRMYIKDEHVEVFSRYAYPVAYATAALVMHFLL